MVLYPYNKNTFDNDFGERLSEAASKLPTRGIFVQPYFSTSKTSCLVERSQFYESD